VTDHTRIARAAAAADSASPLLLSTTVLVDIAAVALDSDPEHALGDARRAAPAFIDDEMLADIVTAIRSSEGATTP
jgi:uncharacterized Rossmann fold enzyme